MHSIGQTINSGCTVFCKNHDYGHVIIIFIQILLYL